MLLSFRIFANAALGKGLSGSDRIFIEFSKRLSKKFKVNIHVWSEGYQMCKRENLKQMDNIHFSIIKTDVWCRLGFIICYFARTILGIQEAIRLNISQPKSTVVYSASEFWMDSLPAFILKLRYPKTTWVAAWFQTAPNPLMGFAESYRKNTYKLSAFLYWLMQLPIKPIISKFADFVLVNNESEKRQFPSLSKKDRAIIVLGAVDLEAIQKFKKLYPRFAKRAKPYTLIPKKYDAVFQGRFHPQKGVVELIDIWKLVTSQLPNATLGMIGDGPLMENVKLKIKNEKLEENIKLFGWVFDGDKKYRIFSESKIVLHPAYYDSGGMAAAEAMAFGLPAIGFNLNSYKSYYPKGMVKIAVGDLGGFAHMVVELLKNKSKRERIGKEAEKMINQSWSWDQRVKQLLATLKM